MVTPSFSIKETEKGFAVTDTTDYSTAQYIGTYALNDYTVTATPTPNTVFKTTLITIDSTVVFNDVVEYGSDGTGNFTNAEEVYNYIIEVVNNYGTIYKARLNKNGTDSWKAWRIEFYSFDANTSGDVVVVNAEGGTITPLVTPLSGTPVSITFRNLLVLDPQGQVVPLGGVSQVENISFNYNSYKEGSVITLSFCSDNIIYPVVNTDTDCIIEDIINLLATEDINKEYYTIDAAKDGNNIVLTQSTVGVPFSVSISTDDVDVIDPFTVSNLTANVPTMSVPTNDTENETVEVEETDKGGEYTVSMTVGSVCDKGSNTESYYSWVYDDIQLDCCFDKMMTKKSCCANTVDKILKISTLRNIFYGIEVAKRDNEDPAKIQSLYDLGWDSCDCDPCCDDCA
jgi:hypothetical protein